MAGFLVVFVGMLLMLTIYFMHPSGRGIMRANLWHFYLVQFPRLFTPQTLGPATGGPSVAAVFLQHILCAGLGGIVSLGIGWALNRSTTRK